MPESVELLRLFIEHAPTALAMFDQDMRYLAASGRWMTDYELGDRDITGLSHYDLFPDIPEAWKRAHRRGLAGETVRATEEPFERTDGSVQWARWELQPWRHRDGRIGGIVIFTEDVTERKGVEHERDTTMRLLAQLNTPGDLHDLMRGVTALISEACDFEAVGIRLCDGDDFPYFETRGFPREFVRTEFRLCEYDERGQIIRDDSGDPVLECMCGNVIRGRFDPALPFFTEHGSFWTNSTTQLLATTTEADRQARTRNRCNGMGYESVGLFPLRTAGATYGLLQVNDHRVRRFTPETVALLERLADNLAVTLAHREVLAERRRAEEELRTSEAKYRLLFETSRDAIMVLNAETWRCEAGNPASLRVFGARDLEEFLGHSFGDYSPLLQPDGRSSAEKAQQMMALTLDEGSHYFDWTHRRLGGEEFPANVLLTRFDMGGKTYVQATVRDMTHELELEAQLRQAQKLESIGTLAGGVAHEINNPIMVILGYAQLIEELVPEDSQVADLVREIEKSTDRVATIVRKLLRFARQEQQGQAPAQLCSLVDDTLSLVRSVIQHDQIILDIDVPADLPDITCVGQQIQQVIMNLVTNAKDALNEKYGDSDSDKIVRISARRSLSADGRASVRLTVEDHGPGIPETIRGRIFDPFFTTKSRDIGTGLGLSISYGIVKDHGGVMSVESEIGRGTRVHVDLPVER